MIKNNPGWDIEQSIAGLLLPNFVHVMPHKDLKPHTYIDCKCNPRVDKENPNLIIYNSYDGREFYEKDNKNLIK